MSEDDAALTTFGAVTNIAAVVLVAAVAVLGIGGAFHVAGDASSALSEKSSHTTPTNMSETGNETNLHILPAETENQTNLHILPAETENQTNLHILPAETENQSNLHPPDITLEEARKQALSAEKTRVTRALDNASYVTSSSVGVYRDPTVTVLDTNSTSITVQVEMPYSYEYSCDGATGAVDGLQTNAVYTVTDSNVSVVTITEDIRNACA